MFLTATVAIKYITKTCEISAFELAIYGKNKVEHAKNNVTKSNIRDRNRLQNRPLKIVAALVVRYMTNIRHKDSSKYNSCNKLHDKSSSKISPLKVKLWQSICQDVFTNSVDTFHVRGKVREENVWQKQRDTSSVVRGDFRSDVHNKTLHNQSHLKWYLFQRYWARIFLGRLPKAVSFTKCQTETRIKWTNKDNMNFRVDKHNEAHVIYPTATPMANFLTKTRTWLQGVK